MSKDISDSLKEKDCTTIPAKLQTDGLLIENAVRPVYSYIIQKYPALDYAVIREELRIIARLDTMPIAIDTCSSSSLATALRERLEETKVYVGTKQTEYEYKHRDCLIEIHAIDDYVNSVYLL